MYGPTTEYFMYHSCQANGEELILKEECCKSKKNKGVRFSPFVSVNRLDQQQEQEEPLWYSPDELAGFKQQTRKCASSLGRIPSGEARGLECYHKQRMLHRYLTVKAVLNVAKKHQNNELLIAEVSVKCSSWNKAMAFHQACHDYLSLYEPDSICHIPDLNQSPPPFPYSLSKKRTSTSSSMQSVAEPSRRVRRKAN